MDFYREGMTPEKNKRIQVKTAGSLPVVCIITHCTDHPYHAQRTEIMTRCYASAQNTGVPAYFVVWDNGSTPAYRDYLQGLGADMLIMTDNIGKQRVELNMMRWYPDNSLCISDDDILFERSWLKSQIELMDAFGADIVSGMVTSAYFYKVPDEMYRRLGHVAHTFVPKELDIQHAYTLGRNEVSAPHYADDKQHAHTVTRGIKAWIGASHAQYICKGDSLARFIRPVGVMDPLAPRDAEMDKAGILRLTTYEPTAYHMGNRIVVE